MNALQKLIAPALLTTALSLNFSEEARGQTSYRQEPLTVERVFQITREEMGLKSRHAKYNPTNHVIRNINFNTGNGYYMTLKNPQAKGVPNDTVETLVLGNNIAWVERDWFGSRTDLAFGRTIKLSWMKHNLYMYDTAIPEGNCYTHEVNSEFTSGQVLRSSTQDIGQKYVPALTVIK